MGKQTIQTGIAGHESAGGRLGRRGRRCFSSQQCPQTQANVVAQEQTPTTTVSPGPGTHYLGPHLWGILNQQASKQTVPTNIDMELHVRGDSTLSESLADHVTRVGGSNVATNIWRVPTSKALTVVHRFDVYHAKLSPSTMADSSSTRDAARRTTISHSRLDDTLDSVATGYANSSVTDVDAARYALFADGGNVLVEIQISTSARRTSVRNWLRQRSIHYLTPTQTGNVYSMAVLLPVSRVKALADAYSDINLRAPSPGEHAMEHGPQPMDAGPTGRQRRPRRNVSFPATQRLRRPPKHRRGGHGRTI